ncbi:hypothetical protein [Cellulosilyticum ruminicola]|uniref:hypothetical protein n=1 Tax=Cellulosilyticum ruminicola TaxID=425254 RepID=UPI0006D019AF|nr:hypothetical protein [Cellulosilyticum ruminicola]
MNLLEIYEDYIAINNEYAAWIETLVNEDFQNDAQPIIRIRLQDTKEQFQRLMEVCSALEVDAENEENFKDLRYLIMDSLFLAGDLETYFKLGELGRFKMRVLNYLNKKRRVDMFSEKPSDSCRAGM